MQPDENGRPAGGRAAREVVGETVAASIQRPDGTLATLVAPCRVDGPGYWCWVCAERDPYGDGRPAASELGELVVTDVALAPDPRCEVCRVHQRCICLALPALTLGGGRDE